MLNFQPDRFRPSKGKKPCETVVNLKATKAIGLDVPSPACARRWGDRIGGRHTTGRMSAFGGKADMTRTSREVRFRPKPDIGGTHRSGVRRWHEVVESAKRRYIGAVRDLACLAVSPFAFKGPFPRTRKIGIEDRANGSHGCKNA